MTSDEKLAFFTRIIDIATKHDVYEDIYIRHGSNGLIAYVNCNDLFWWACADAEEITPENIEVLVQCLEEFKPYRKAWFDWRKTNRDLKPEERTPEPPHVFESTALSLFCARVRKMRPQGACYRSFPPGIAELFDAAGPERPAEFGNTPRGVWSPKELYVFQTTDDPPWHCPQCHPGAKALETGSEGT